MALRKSRSADSEPMLVRLMGRLGVKMEEQISSTEQARLDRHYNWELTLRDLCQNISRGIKAYFQDGDRALLVKHLDRPLLDALLERLDELYADNLYWSQPREVHQRSEVQILDEEKDSAGRVRVVHLRESFEDRSRLRRTKPGGEELVVLADRRAPGERRQIKVTMRLLPNDTAALQALERSA